MPGRCGRPFGSDQTTHDKEGPRPGPPTLVTARRPASLSAEPEAAIKYELRISQPSGG